VNRQVDVAKKLNKPIVMEEYGYPRDGFSFERTSKTTARDEYYRFVYSLLGKSKMAGGNFAGCNFWGWGGLAKPIHESWKSGDDYCGDPAQEQQGLNSVFSTDTSTLKVIKEAVSRYLKK
jgi:mannan endo-1,4-beta-mannosidase